MGASTLANSLILLRINYLSLLSHVRFSWLSSLSFHLFTIVEPEKIGSYLWKLFSNNSTRSAIIGAACHTLGTGSMNAGYVLGSVLLVQLFKSGEPVVTYIFSVFILAEVGRCYD